jgi:hypothetical protein
MLERGTWSEKSRMQQLPLLLTALGSYMFAKFNAAYEATARYKQGNMASPAAIAKLAVDYALLFILEAAAVALVFQGGKEDEDEYWATWLAKQGGLQFAGTMPYVREFASAAQGFSGGGTQGAIVETIFLGMKEGGEFSLRQFGLTESEETTRSELKTMINLTGLLTGLPSSQFNRMITAYYDKDMGKRSNIDVLDYLVTRPEN